MYTIKINVKELKDPSSKSKGRTIPDNLKNTLYLEASNILTKIYSRDEKTSIDDLSAKIYEESPGDYTIHNSHENSWSILHIGYSDNKGEYRNMLIFSGAVVYIMQNGKTIDSIYV